MLHFGSSMLPTPVLRVDEGCQDSDDKYLAGTNRGLVLKVSVKPSHVNAVDVNVADHGTVEVEVLEGDELLEGEARF